MTGMEHTIEHATTRRAVSTLTASLYGSAVSPEEQEKAERAIAALTRAGLLRSIPAHRSGDGESIEEAYQRGHEDGYWNGKTTDMSPAQAAAFMAPYRSRCPGCADRAEGDGSADR